LEVFCFGMIFKVDFQRVLLKCDAQLGYFCSCFSKAPYEFVEFFDDFFELNQHFAAFFFTQASSPEYIMGVAGLFWFPAFFTEYLLHLRQVQSEINVLTVA